MEIDAKLVFTVLHLFGIALGAGGAYVSDLIFLRSIRDGRISKTEFSFLELGSNIVWLGLGLLLFSGSGLFAFDIEKYMNSTKFQAKMTIIFILVINGLLFRYFHMERFRRYIGKHLWSSEEFMKHWYFVAASGAVSVVSWTSALVLGSLSGVPYTYGFLMMMYFGLVSIGILGALAVLQRE